MEEYIKVFGEEAAEGTEEEKKTEGGEEPKKNPGPKKKGAPADDKKIKIVKV